MEFVWKVHEDFDSYIFSSVMFNTYLAPKGFDFDYRENHKWKDIQYGGYKRFVSVGKHS